MLKSFICLCFFPLGLFGCSLHQPVKIEPLIPHNAEYMEQFSTNDPSAPIERWWLTFNDPQLNQIIDQLFSNNLQLEEAFARLEQAQAALKIVGSTRWPKLNLGGQGSRELIPGFTGDSYVLNYRFSAQSSFEIDLWGKLKNRREAAFKRVAVSRNQLQTLYLSISAQLAELYYLAIEQRAQIKLLIQTIGSYQETLQLVENRYRQGLTNALAVYQARQNLAAVKANLPRFEKNLAVAEHGISSLLGQSPERDITGTLAKLPLLTEQFPTGIPADLLHRRPDIQEGFNQLQSADAEVAAAIAERLPTLNLAANYGFLQTDFGIGALTGSFWQLLIQPTLPLIDGGRRRADVIRNRAIVRERLARYRQVILDAWLEVEDALSATREGEERISLLTTSATAAEASQRLTLDNYLRGLSDYLPVLSSQRNVIQTQSELVATRRQLISERITLARSLGGSWMEAEIQQRFEEHKELTSDEY